VLATFLFLAGGFKGFIFRRLILLLLPIVNFKRGIGGCETVGGVSRV
jgi:hypothetical protein